MLSGGFCQLNPDAVGLEMTSSVVCFQSEPFRGVFQCYVGTKSDSTDMLALNQWNQKIDVVAMTCSCWFYMASMFRSSEQFNLRSLYNNQISHFLTF